MAMLRFGGVLAGILSIAVGIIIIVWPRIIAYIIGIYLVIVGLIALLAALRFV